jgi:hypothetical protein
MSLISNSDDKYKRPRNLFPYVSWFYLLTLQQQNTIYASFFQPFTKTYFPAVSFLPLTPKCSNAYFYVIHCRFRPFFRRNPDGAIVATAKWERTYGCLGACSQAGRRAITQGCGLATGIPRFLRA